MRKFILYRASFSGFLLFNQLHRHTNCRSTSLRVKAQKKHIDAVTRITKHPDFMVRLEAANANPDSGDAKKLLASLHPHIITLGAKAPYGPAARKASFNHFLAALNRCQARFRTTSCLLSLLIDLCVSQVWYRAVLHYNGLQ